MGKVKNKESRDRCIELLKQSSVMEDARKLGKAQGFEAPISVWFSAFRKILGGEGSSSGSTGTAG